jgi:hypothetical protein
MRLFLKTFFICAIGISAAQTFATPIPVVSVKKDSDGVTLRSRQEFVLAPGEAIYGLGQHQDGLINYRGPRSICSSEIRAKAPCPSWCPA